MKTLLCSFLLISASAFASPLTLHPFGQYDVTVPSLDGDPSTNQRVTGQLYFDVAAAKFKGIDGTGAVRTFLTTGSGSNSIGAKVIINSPTVTAGATTALSFTAANAAFDTSSIVGTNQFIAPGSGIYNISVYGHDTTAYSFVELLYQVNGGSWVTVCFGVGAGATPTCTGSDVVSLSALDVVQFEIYTPDNTVDQLRLSITGG